jgi:protein-L-isoaspartate(D-aspartate) O-methyltransferase
MGDLDIAIALLAVNEDHYTRADDGSRYPQTTAKWHIVEMLKLLDVSPGHRVLEIGTGSGLSTALLSHLVGDNGLVVSLDIDPEPSERARRLLEREGIHNVHIKVADGRDGSSADAPFQRLIAWASTRRVTPAWVEQTPVNAILVIPIRDGGRTHAIRYRRVGATIVEEARIPSGFAWLTSFPFRPWQSMKHPSSPS